MGPRGMMGFMRPDPDDEPVLSAQSAEEAGIGWGEAPEPAAGQAVAASGSGALAQATSDLIPYSLLAATCLVTLGLTRIRPRPEGDLV
jgi:hypothetical protein